MHFFRDLLKHSSVAGDEGAIVFAKNSIACLGNDSVNNVKQEGRYEMKHFGPTVTG